MVLNAGYNAEKKFDNFSEIASLKIRPSLL
jgi:hypothetical protein